MVRDAARAEALADGAAPARRRAQRRRIITNLARPRVALVEAFVLAIFVGNEMLTGESGTTRSGSVVDLAVEALFLIPILYAALNFGVAGSLLTGGWVSLLIVAGDIAVDLANRRPLEAASDALMMLILDAVAVFVGWRMAVEQSARDRYWDLFDSNAAPILIVSGDGAVLEANAAARHTLAPAPMGAGARDRDRLVGRTLEGLLGRAALQPLAGASALVTPLGSRTQLRAVPSQFRGQRGETQVQIIFTSPTEEMRREQEAAAYARRVLASQEDERRRVAQELHDGPVQSLIQLCRSLDTAEEKAESIGDTRAEVARARDVAERIVAELRTIVRGLRPPALEHLGLIPTLGRLLDEFGERAAVVTHLEVTGSARRLDGDRELTLFRIAQEALSNAERHARAATVRLAVAFSDDAVALTVRDDGVGFSVPDPAERALETSGLGLRGMAERVQLVDGELSVTSEPGRGTAVHVVVPLDAGAPVIGVAARALR